jgi:hypothetical protein
MKKHICKNCLLYDKENGVCKVTIILEGQYYELPTLPNNDCYWEKNDLEIKQIKMWSDGENGFIEMPDDEEV